ncbi:MAG TPA: ABC transporter substrate-binding protein [Mycobacteriales bacterium]|nr:ABC transporter substrate-binding protein [Mycobacteriales bacterium]
MPHPARARLAGVLTLSLVSVPSLLGAVGCARTTLADSGGVCAVDGLHLVRPGRLVIATERPASEPWFTNDDPANGQGFEAAVAYAVAERLGFRRDDVTWVGAPSDPTSMPGRRNFDFDIDQVAITAERSRAVTFSDSYYTVNQAVVAMASSRIAPAGTIVELRKARLGAQAGTTSLAVIQQVVRPVIAPTVLPDTSAAEQALRSGRVDGIVVDLPTAFQLTSTKIEGAKIVGQLESADAAAEQLGLVFEKDNPLVGCVNQALAELRNTGELQRLEDTWLADSVGAPHLP